MGSRQWAIGNGGEWVWVHCVGRYLPITRFVPCVGLEATQGLPVPQAVFGHGCTKPRVA
jgi:hypothetical protein